MDQFPSTRHPAGTSDPAGSAAPEPILAVENLSKSYGENWAVRGISLVLRPGEVLGLVGPNGAGKTTTLRTVAGVLPIESGTVRIAGHDLERDELEAKRHLAWVPDQPTPFDALTVWEHLEFTAALYRVANWKERARELLENFELAGRRDALGGELSRGMCQKLALCTALLHEPRLLLLDEPLSGLDPVGIRAAKRAVFDLVARGGAVVLSSHLLGVVQELSTRLAIVRGGRVLFDGNLDDARRAASAGADSDLEAVFFAVTDGAGLTETAAPIVDAALAAAEAEANSAPNTDSSTDSNVDLNTAPIDAAPIDAAPRESEVER
jgi:ABC-2 type transport system ATP-binding protein